MIQKVDEVSLLSMEIIMSVAVGINLIKHCS